MSRLWKRFFALICVLALALSCCAAQAEFSSRYEKMAREGYTLRLSGKAEIIRPLKKDDLAEVNGWLENFRVQISAGDTPQLKVDLDEETLLLAQAQRQSGYTLTAFDGSGAYLTRPEAPDGLLLLNSREYGWVDFSFVPGAYLKMAPQLFEKLGSHVTPKKSKDRTSIKNASASQSNETYTFSGDDLNEFWTRILDTLLPAMEEALGDHPSLYAKAEETLEELAFSGECRFKRFLDKEGNDMGLQFTGNAAIGEDTRKITLFYGFTPNKGGYLSFSAPAVKGKNNLKITVSVETPSKGSVSSMIIEASYNNTLNGKTVSDTLNTTLRNTVKEGDEKWSGKVTLSRTENKVKSVWSMIPNLAFTDEGLSGTVEVTKRLGNQSPLKLILNVQALPYQKEEIASPASAKDLRAMSVDKAQGALQYELDAVIGQVMALLAELPEKDRAELVKNFATDAWFTGAMVPVLETALNRVQGADELGDD